MISIFIRTILIYLLLTFLMKIMGKRQIGELEANELVSTLLISEVAAAPIGDADIPLLNAAIPIIFICCIEVAVAAIKNKSFKLKKAVEGEPTYIIYKGILKQNTLVENRISITEVLTEMRTQGIGDISDVYYGILEQNGKLSLLTGENKNSVAHTLIIDTKPDHKTLMELGRDQMWLNDILKNKNIEAKDIFLMTINDKGSLNIIRKEEKQ